MASNDCTTAVLSAFLQKQTIWRFKWDTCFFTLDGRRIAHCVTEDGPEKKFGNVLSLLRHVDVSESLTFRVWLDDGDCWTLRATTEEQHKEWTDRITTVLLQDSAPTSPYVRCGGVLKKGEWTGKWNQRYVDLDACRMAYRPKREGPVKRRVVIVSVDISEHNEELLITTSCGARFWLKFLTLDQCKDWYNVIMYGVVRYFPWHWQQLTSPKAYTYKPLCVQLHALSSKFSDSSTVYCYGGTNVLATLRYVSEQKLFMPIVQPGTVGRQLFSFKLAGDHPCTLIETQPHEESANAKLRPPPLYGAAMCSLEMNVPTLSETPVVRDDGVGFGATNGHDDGSFVVDFGQKCTPRRTVECLVLVGGRDEACSTRETTTELWCCELSEPSPRWYRYVVSQSALPRRAFHTLTAQDPTCAVLIGGMDNEVRARRECYSISWPLKGEGANTSATSCFSEPPLIEKLNPLPEPRAFHACVRLQDKSLLVLSGCAMCGNPEETSGDVLRLSSISAKWQVVRLNSQLPSMFNPSAAADVAAGKERVFLLGEHCALPPTVKLFELIMESQLSATVREILLCTGSIPKYCSGTALHINKCYLYAVGGCASEYKTPENGTPCTMDEPMRMVIGPATEEDITTGELTGKCTSSVESE
ncbi:hypothetical protein ERJ75_000722500 [Trypanosoma vivax]|uniref:PH domain-containing protein n=1 Tax=Trypanosoma vivax (strain Y486) TaxID=1055687 RepID=G0TWX0_TRYVY|nr:hypothetical protein TRVL_09181 [Trypanosoma vivax]KAH8614233.1 hypothetical protein ERJ75_000722500 [Trypanosoma vivax]CCC48458.1 conserved hypothetical protein [Trypanosoma vivax Y486]